MSVDRGRDKRRNPERQQIKKLGVSMAPPLKTRTRKVSNSPSAKGWKLKPKSRSMPSQCRSCGAPQERRQEVVYREYSRELLCIACAERQGVKPRVSERQRAKDGTATIGRHLRRLGFPRHATYADYLASPHWQDVKRRYSESDLPQDCACGKPRRDLHHKTYARMGAELLTDLEPVCGLCHLERHGRWPMDLVEVRFVEPQPRRERPQA
jgi:hypothetical protein